MSEEVLRKKGLSNPENHEKIEVSDPEKALLLFVDVNLGQGRAERIIVYEGDTSEHLANQFAKEHSTSFIKTLFKK